MSSLTGPAPRTTLLLHAGLYPLAAIERTAAALSGAARFTVRSGSPHHRIDIETEGAPEAIAHEFANQVLVSALEQGSPE